MTEPISEAERAKAKELCAKATPGPWVAVREDDQCAHEINGEDWGSLATVVTRMEREEEDEPTGLANAELIAFSRTAIPAYEARVVELEAALKAAEERYTG